MTHRKRGRPDSVIELAVDNTEDPRVAEAIKGLRTAYELRWGRDKNGKTVLLIVPYRKS